MGMLGWMLGSGNDEIGDGEITLVEATGQILAHGRTGESVVVWSEEDVKRLRSKLRNEAINGKPVAKQGGDTSKHTPGNESIRKGASAEEIYSGYQ